MQAYVAVEAALAAVTSSLENMLQARGETAVYFMLGTLGGQRRYAGLQPVGAGAA